jgi:hypothetical protein
MNEHKSKTKAFVITFIVVLLLLIAGAYLFFGTKSDTGTSQVSGSSSSIGKFFSSLFATQKPTDINTDTSGASTTAGSGATTGTGEATAPAKQTGFFTGLYNSVFGRSNTNTASINPNNSGTLGAGTTNPNNNTANINPNTGTNSSSGSNSTTGFPTGTTGGAGGFTTGTGAGATGGFGAGGSQAGGNGFVTTGGFGITPTLNPVPTPGTGTGFTTGTGAGPSTGSFASGNGSGSGTGFGSGPQGGGFVTTTGAGPITGDKTNICDDSLIFTAAEQTKLDDLLRQYYLLAPSLKTDGDISVLLSSKLRDQSTIDDATALTKQCISQKADPAYTGPQAVKDNPYFKKGSLDAYLPDFADFEKLFNIW